MGHATHRERYGSLLNVSLPPQLGSVSRAKGRERGSERNEMDGGGAAIPDDTRRLLGGNLRTPRTYLRFVDCRFVWLCCYDVDVSSEGRALHRSYFCLFSKYSTFPTKLQTFWRSLESEPVGVRSSNLNQL